MAITFLFSRLRSLSLETGYGLEQSRWLLQKQAEFVDEFDFAPDDSSSAVLEAVGSELVLVLTDPLAIVSPNMVATLTQLLDTQTEAVAAVPATNLSENTAQRREMPPSFLTMGQFERRFYQTNPTSSTTRWTDADPGLFLARAEALEGDSVPFRNVLKDRQVAVAEEAFLYRYTAQQRMPRTDLAEMIPTNVKSVLEIGCGEGILGEQIRDRQGARVVGVEIDSDAAARAASRLDRVYGKDIRDAIREITERFEWIVGGDVIEHLADPWEFLRELKRVAEPGGHLLLSIPNIGTWPVIAELLRGRFDYVYAGHLSAGHLRFFTRKTIEDTIAMGFWQLEWIRAQPDFAPEEREELFEKLDRGGIAYSREDLAVPGWYVLARNV